MMDVHQYPEFLIIHSLAAAVFAVQENASTPDKF